MGLKSPNPHLHSMSHYGFGEGVIYLYRSYPSEQRPPAWKDDMHVLSFLETNTTYLSILSCEMDEYIVYIYQVIQRAGVTENVSS